MDPVQPSSKKPKNLSDDLSADLTSQNGQLASSPKNNKLEDKLNDQKRLTKIKKELKRMQNETPTAETDMVKPGSLGSSTSPTDSPPTEDSQKTTDEPPIETPNKKSPGLNFLMVLGPLFLAGSLAFSIYTLKFKKTMPETYVAEKATEGSVKQTLENAPLNPTKTTARCQSTRKEIISGQPSSCPDPLFTWSGEKTREPGTKIIGYWVYFGEKNNIQPLYYGEKGKDQDLWSVVRPIADGKFQETNQFKPTSLEKGKTFYLAVTARSDSKNLLWSFGLTNPDTNQFKAQAAEILFTFVYE